MRVIAGKFKGRRLAAPTWSGLRPTSDKLKGTLFEILGAAIPGARVLDGCAGSGALGIEALSRGAAEVVFVERDARAIALLSENLERCGVAGGYAMMRGELAGVLSQLPATLRFDVILLDPPYDDPAASAMVGEAAQRLAPDGLVVLEHARRVPPPLRSRDLVLSRQVRSGDSGLAFYRRPAAAVE
jgi:16S rRNA (guanine966-N2)-methyltransferase